MKILIFNTLYHPYQIGGAEKSVQLLAEGLQSSNHEVVVMCTADNERIEYVNNVKVYYLKQANLYWSYFAKEEKAYKKPLWHFIDSYNPFTKKIKKIIQNEKPDVVHTNNLAGFSVSIWKLVKSMNIKLVHTIRDYYLLCPKSTMYKNDKNCDKQCLVCGLYSAPKKIMSQYVDVVVGISEFVLKKHLESGYFKNAKIKTIIYNSIERPLSVEKIPHEGIVFGYVGTLAKSKGIEFLLDYFFNHPVENAVLYIFGKGESKKYEDQLKQKYIHPQIVFQGFKKPNEIYPNIDILIVPSLWHEPFGRIVPEANSYGVPVLVSNRGGLPELVNDGVNGCIFDVDNASAFDPKKLMDKLRRFEFIQAPSNIANDYFTLYSGADQL